jgi:hypothetical protein
VGHVSSTKSAEKLADTSSTTVSPLASVYGGSTWRRLKLGLKQAPKPVEK